MKLFFCGDFASENGPGIANRNLMDGFCRIQTSGDQFIFSTAKTKVKRIFELGHIAGSEALILCSDSAINKFAIWFANLLHVKVVYLAHGLATVEESFYKENTRAEQKYENFIFSHVDRIIALSKKLADLIKYKYPCYKDKVTYSYNSIPYQLIDKEYILKRDKSINRIISVGGARYQKCMVPICRAVEKLNAERKTNLECVIIGNSKDQIDEMTQFSSVTYIEKLSHEELLSLLQKGGIYVQNSLFETFGLAIVEALAGGCDLLVSSKCGVIDLFDGIRDEDIIRNNEDVDEIASKIENLLYKGNWEYLDSHFLWEMVKTETAASRTMNILRNEKNE